MTAAMDPILTKREVCSFFRKSASWITYKTDPKSPYWDPAFPIPLKFGNKRNSPVGWKKSDIDRYVNKLTVKGYSPESEAA